MRRYIVEVDRTSLDEYYWRLKSRNGRILAHSEGIKNESDCTRVAMGLAEDLDISPVAICKYKVLYKQ